jgi:5-methylcytosine-specific restriction endonuclease McrA
MPRHRPPKEIWDDIRRQILARDNYECVRCRAPLSESTMHCDHIRSGKLATNELSNLRSLCRRCHVLRADHRHRGMIAGALRDGVIPPNWRELVWEDIP